MQKGERGGRREEDGKSGTRKGEGVEGKGVGKVGLTILLKPLNQNQVNPLLLHWPLDLLFRRDNTSVLTHSSTRGGGG